MRTHYVGDTPLDDARLTKDLDQSASLPWSEAYSDYVFGGAWKSCMLWARGGRAGDGVVTHYDHERPAAFTEFAEPPLSTVNYDVDAVSRMAVDRLLRLISAGDVLPEPRVTLIDPELIIRQST